MMLGAGILMLAAGLTASMAVMYTLFNDPVVQEYMKETGIWTEGLDKHYSKAA